MTAWPVERRTGGASELHAEHPAERDVAAPSVLVLEVDRPALVLGSAQSRTDVDQAEAERQGIEVVRRRSGGGAVLLVPGEHLWVDVLLPRSDPRWVDDVSRSAGWLGRWWQSALGRLGVEEVAVHDGPMEGRALGRVVCFGGLAAGEVVRGRGGSPAKLVGISQRRTRAAARFQCVILRRWDPDALSALLRPGLEADGRASLADLAVATIEPPSSEVLDALGSTEPPMV
jgi:lipoate---protein ligase